MPSPKLAEQLGYILASANRKLEEELAERLRPGGIAVEQFRILEALSQTGPMPMGGLADAILVEPATLTKMIDRMVSETLVFRMPDERDRRRVLVALAPAGQALYKKLAGVALAHERQIAEKLDEQGVSALRNLLLELIGR